MISRRELFVSAIAASCADAAASNTTPLTAALELGRERLAGH